VLNGALFFLKQGRLKYPMRVFTIGFLWGVLLISGCTRQQVNQYSVISDDEDDEAETIALKTAGNLVPWAAEAVACLAYTVLGAATEKIGSSPEFFPGWGSKPR
jgi:hypothetical protein